MTLHTSQVAVEIAGKMILEQIDLQVKPGAFVGVIGPNGSGKSTLLKTIYRV